MNKYSFAKRRQIHLKIPSSYRIGIAGAEKTLTVDYATLQDTGRQLDGWSISLKKEARTQSVLLNLVKYVNPREQSIITVELMRASDSAAEIYPEMRYLRADTGAAEEDTVSVRGERIQLRFDSFGIIEAEETGETQPAQAENGTFSAAREAGQPDPEEADYKAHITALRREIQDMTEQIARLDAELKSLEAQRNARAEQIRSKQEEIREKTERLARMEEDGELAEQALEQEYLERLAALKERLGDTAFAMEKQAGEQELHEIGRRMEAAGQELDELDRILAGMILKKEKDSRNLTAAIFDNDGVMPGAPE